MALVIFIVTIVVLFTQNEKSEAVDTGTRAINLFDDSARVNEKTPALNEPFIYGQQKIQGVNIGGWLVIEPFITPSLFDQFPQSAKVIDEWTLCEKLGPEEARKQLKAHYDSFIVEEDFKKISKMGLNHVRIPVGHWAIETEPTEPYVAKLSWEYLLKGIQWARKYGIRVMVELHTAPGSQNGWNHSGKEGVIQWLNGTHGSENANRTLSIVQTMTNFFSDPKWSNVVPLFGVLNEPFMPYLSDPSVVKNWYQKSYDTIRSGTNAPGPFLSYHDGFLGLPDWEGYFKNYDRTMLEAHMYLIFDQGLVSMSREDQSNFPCTAWRSSIIQSTNATALTMVGEFSLATNDCAKYLNGVGKGTRYDGTLDPNHPESACPGCTCVGSEDWKSWTKEYKSFLSSFVQHQMDAYESGVGWFFWTYKTEGHNNPHWDYLLGWEQGWIPSDPSNRNFSCKTANVKMFNSVYQN
ncbi:glycoside hydrolase superfamily [Spinellus fusiger]|nr:glycoside hydrolase superfamily [Spinellus fusiger]